MAADTDLDPAAGLTIARASAVLVVPGARPWIALRLGPDLLGVPLLPAAARELSQLLAAEADHADASRRRLSLRAAGGVLTPVGYLGARR